MDGRGARGFLVVFDLTDRASFREAEAAVQAIVERFEYDPNRSAWIALLRYQEDDALAYILAPQDLNVGDTVRCGEGAPFSPGNAMPLQFMPDGTIGHNIEIRPGWGGKMMRAAGTSARPCVASSSGLMRSTPQYSETGAPSAGASGPVCANAALAVNPSASALVAISVLNLPVIVSSLLSFKS